MSAELPIAEFDVIEADKLEHAVELVSQTPCATALAVAKVWPLELIA